MNLSDVKVSREDLLDHLYAATISAQQCQTDILFSDEKNIVQLLDFSAFHDGIWRRARPKNIFDAVGGELFRELVVKRQLPFDAAVSSLTFLEVLESFTDKIDEMKMGGYESMNTRLAKVKENLKAIQTEPANGNEHVLDIRSEFMAQELAVIEKVTGKSTSRSIGFAQQLLGADGPVMGLGDLYGPTIKDLKINHDELTRLQELMWQSRSDRDQRDSSEKEFRYWVDAMNIHIVNQLRPVSNIRQTNYVSRASHIKYTQHELGRTPLVPLFWLKADRNSEFLSKLEQADFFRGMAEQAQIVHRRIQTRHEIPKNGDVSFRLFTSFNDNYMGELDLLGVPGAYNGDANKDRLFHDKLFAKNELDKNIAKAESTFSKLLDQYGGIRGDDLLEKGDASRIHYYEELIEKLRSNRQS